MLALLAVAAALAPCPARAAPLAGAVHGSRAGLGHAAHGGRPLGCLHALPLPAAPAQRLAAGARLVGEPPLKRRLRAALRGFPTRAFVRSAALRRLLGPA